jgi:quercetin dioxygenase-like cupin family protein
MKDGEKVEFENNRVRVLRVKIGKREKHPPRERKDRVLIWLTDAHETRTEPNGKKEEIRRKPGDVLWRAASRHQVENVEDQDVELIIVEMKD